MKGVFKVFRFTFLESVRKKSFILSTLLLMVLTVAVLCVPAVIDHYKSPGNEKTAQEDAQGTLYVIDGGGVLPLNETTGLSVDGYKLSTAQPDEKDGLVSEIKNTGTKVLAVVSESGGTLSYDYYVKSTGSGPDPDAVSAALKNLYASRLLTQNGVSNTVIGSVLSAVKYEVHSEGKGMVSGYLPAIAVSLLLFMTIYMYGYWVAMSIASEKTSRVMELLITSTKPSRIVIGKSAAMGLLGLCQLLAVILTAAAAFRIANPGSFSLDGMSINFSVFTPFYAVMMIVYFLLGFALYAMINAVAGATVSNADDVRSAVTPISFISLIAFYFAYGTFLVPDSAAAVAASLVPFSAPFSMASRILMAEVPVWQIALSLVLLAGTTVLMAMISIRLYSSAVLHYGKKLKISELVAMSKNNR